MTKGQIEFLVVIGVFILGFSSAGVMIYKNHEQAKLVKPISNTLLLNNGSTNPVTQTNSNPIMGKQCNVLTDVKVNDTAEKVEKLCGAPDIIDINSDEVKKVEKVFKADKIWYYLKSKAFVEVTDGYVTKVAPMVQDSK